MKRWQDSQTELNDLIANSSRFGIITDVDGTLSPIVDDPDAAEILPSIRKLLTELLPEVTLLALVSGRSVADLRLRLDDPRVVYVGNHGFEWFIDGQFNTVPEVEAHRPALEATLKAMKVYQEPGLGLEDKGATISIHYRRTAYPVATKNKLLPIVEKLANQKNLDLFQGRMVFELRPPVEINKGTALARLVDLYQLDGVIFMGDDTTDADALKMVQKLRQEDRCLGFAFAVLSDDTPDVVLDSADLSLDGVLDVERFLAWLSNACTASSN